MKSTIDIAIFQKRLAQTIAWCSSRVVANEPATCLRSFDLRPPGKGIASRLNLQWDEIVTAMAQERERWLHYSGELPVGLANGRLLISTGMIESVWDGAGEAESQGFLDGADLPPWDTWLCYLQEDLPNASDSQRMYHMEYLVSWVPSQFIEQVNGGIEVQCVDCVRWAQDYETTFTRHLDAAGLLEQK